MFRIGKRKKEDREIIWWFEIPATDINRAQKFYESILKIKMTYEENELYKTAFFPLFDDHVGGSIIEGKGYTPGGDGSKIYLNGHPDLQNILDLVTNAGGEILVPKTSLSPNKFFAWIKDTEGNKIGITSKN